MDISQLPKNTHDDTGDYRDKEKEITQAFHPEKGQVPAFIITLGGGT